MCECIFHVFLITLVAIALIQDRNLDKFQPTLTIIENKPKFNFLTPYSEVKNVLINLNNSRVINIDIDFTSVPKPCINQPFLLIILVTSYIFHVDKRDNIRETWGRANNAVKVVFTVGVVDGKRSMNHIMFEKAYFRDILQGNFQDTYRNLSYKHMMGLKWVTHHCPTARYVIKTDDDVFVNIDELMKFLIRESSPWGAQGLIAGTVLRNRKPYRKKYEKWSVTRKEYPGNTYPNFCMGAVVLYSQDVLPYLVNTSLTTKFFHIEDTFVTGILAEKVGISRTDISYLYLINLWASKVNLPLAPLYKKGYKGVRHFIVGPIDLATKQIRMMWQLMPGVKAISSK